WPPTSRPSATSRSRCRCRPEVGRRPRGWRDAAGRRDPRAPGVGPRPGGGRIRRARRRAGGAGRHRLPERAARGRPGPLFDAPAPIDWAALARRHVGVIDAGHPTRDQLDALHAIRNDFGHSEVGYDAPVDPRLAARTYYLLHGTGVAPLRLLRLRGTVRY